MYNDIYTSIAGKKYKVNVINEYDSYCDFELDPKIDNVTFLKVRSYMVEKNEKSN